VTCYEVLKSPVGPLLAAGTEHGLTRLQFGGAAGEGWVERRGMFGEAARQLELYFAGKLREFVLELQPDGTEFQLEVWRELRRIPYGETIAYGELARRLGKPAGAARAVGLANGANPIAIIIPCHRVIGSDGKMTGFGGGVDVKRRLLALERGEALLV
jgi:methylated-DNA-[protein]-cysteine S-methyltransferase